jgi:hypothetical protein
VRVEVLKGGGLENDHVTIPVGEGCAALLAPHFKRRDARHKPLVDPWPGDGLDQRDTIVTATSAHTEIHRGIHEDLPVHGPPWPVGQGRRANLVRGTLATSTSGCNDFCHTGIAVCSSDSKKLLLKLQVPSAVLVAIVTKVIALCSLLR